jgi:hypothetical protein
MIVIMVVVMMIVVVNHATGPGGKNELSIAGALWPCLQPRAGVCRGRDGRHDQIAGDRMAAAV